MGPDRSSRELAPAPELPTEPGRVRHKSQEFLPCQQLLGHASKWNGRGVGGGMMMNGERE